MSHLRIEERLKLEHLLNESRNFQEIADRLKKARSTIVRTSFPDFSKMLSEAASKYAADKDCRRRQRINHFNCRFLRQHKKY